MFLQACFQHKPFSPPFFIVVKTHHFDIKIAPNIFLVFCKHKLDIQVTWPNKLCHHYHCSIYGAFTLDVKLELNENLGGILGGTQC